MKRLSALVICPGRGTYNRQELGYLAKNHHQQQSMLSGFDKCRIALGQPSLTQLDSATTYSTNRLTRGDNASSLIYACAYADFLSINHDKFDIVGVAGNSMGWYIALACAGVLEANHGFKVVNTMGTLMQEALIGDQLLYPYVDENWIEIPRKRNELMALTDRISGLYLSINLGGMIVFAGTEKALKTCAQGLKPIQGKFPIRLHNHAAFHSPLQQPISVIAKEQLHPPLFQQPKLPLIDGRGHVWLPKASDQADLWDYTLGHQVVAPFDFHATVRSALREFAPDNIIVLGPGQSLGGAIAQCLIAENWQGIHSKKDFIDRQAEQPFLLSMGIDEQRAVVI